ncbi:hypothetical protein CMI37_35565 [Candidatus Pacearchaeota archaeon]|nr:hypothetical protein [Candidatus Pacearchaeota archaeon]
MALQRMQDQHQIGFLDSQPKDTPVSKTSGENAKSLSSLAEEQKAKVFNPKDSVLKSGRSIKSSRAGEVTDMGGPSKFIGSESANSVWNNTKIEEAAAKEVSTTAMNEDPKALRQQAEKERLDKLVSSLQTVDQRKASSVAPTGTSEGSGPGFKATSNNMSIFDTKDFERLAEKTAGEKVTEEAKQRKSQVDESWKNNGKSVTSSDVVNRMFDNLNRKIVGK